MSHFYRLKYVLVNSVTGLGAEVESVIESRLDLSSTDGHRIIMWWLSLANADYAIVNLRVSSATDEHRQAEVETKKIIEKMMS